MDVRDSRLPPVSRQPKASYRIMNQYLQCNTVARMRDLSRNLRCFIKSTALRFFWNLFHWIFRPAHSIPRADRAFNMRSFVLFIVFFLSSSVGASILDAKFGVAQIFDVQWNISGGNLNASGFNYIFAAVNYSTQTDSAARWTSAQATDASSNGRYVAFFNSVTTPGTYGLAVFNSDGTQYKIIGLCSWLL